MILASCGVKLQMRFPLKVMKQIPIENDQEQWTDPLPPIQERLIQFLLFDTLEDAKELLRRYREVDNFNLYVRRNTWLVIAAVLVIFLTSIACVMGMLSLLPDMHWLFVLPLLALLPVVLVGSVFVLTYVFFSWIEGRSLALALGKRHRPAPGPIAIWLQEKLNLDMSPLPSIPWTLAGIFLFFPLFVLAQSWMAAALAVTALVLVMSILYARFDR